MSLQVPIKIGQSQIGKPGNQHVEAIHSARELLFIQPVDDLFKQAIHPPFDLPQLEHTTIQQSHILRPPGRASFLLGHRSMVHQFSFWHHYTIPHRTWQ